jgi:hypothetical protein
METSVCEKIQSILVFGEHIDQLGKGEDATTLKGFLRIGLFACYLCI